MSLSVNSSITRSIANSAQSFSFLWTPIVSFRLITVKISFWKGQDRLWMGVNHSTEVTLWDQLLAAANVIPQGTTGRCMFKRILYNPQRTAWCWSLFAGSPSSPVVTALYQHCLVTQELKVYCRLWIGVYWLGSAYLRKLVDFYYGAQFSYSSTFVLNDLNFIWAGTGSTFDALERC